MHKVGIHPPNTSAEKMYLVAFLSPINHLSHVYDVIGKDRADVTVRTSIRNNSNCAVRLPALRRGSLFFSLSSSLFFALLSAHCTLHTLQLSVRYGMYGIGPYLHIITHFLFPSAFCVLRFASSCFRIHLFILLIFLTKDYVMLQQLWRL